MFLFATSASTTVPKTRVLDFKTFVCLSCGPTLRVPIVSYFPHSHAIPQNLRTVLAGGPANETRRRDYTVISVAEQVVVG